MAGTTTVRRFDMGRVFRNGFAVFNRFPVTLLAIGALLTFPTVIATDWANLHLIGPRPPADDIPASLRRIGMLGLVGLLAAGIGWLRVAAVALCVVAAEAGEARLDYGALVSKLLARLPALYLLGVVSALGIALGLVLLIIPGLIIALAWSLGPIVAMREDKSLSLVLSRSAALTSGYRIQIFGIYLLFFLAGAALEALARAALGVPLLANQPSDPALDYIVQPAISAVLGAIEAAILAAAYTELRMVKEGATSDQVARTFS